MAGPKRDVGVFLLGDLPPNRIAEMAQRVEAAGFTEIWIAEDYFMLSAFATSGIALQATESIRVGIGAIANRVRHPAVAAMEASTLAGAFPGRFRDLGLGHGVPAWMRQMDLFPKSVLTSMSEAVHGIKRLAKGETLTEKGDYYSFDKVSLTHKAPDLRVLTAVVGPKSVDLTARIADGLQISVLAGPRYVKQVAERVAALRKAEGLSPDFQIVTYALACIDPDSAQARRKMRKFAAFYLHAMGPTQLTEVYGVNERLSAMLDEGGAEAVERDMPDEWLDWIGIAGSPEEATASMQALFEAGSTSVVLCIVPSEELPEQLDLIGKDVLPKLA
ncbi:LLM class flavin-dependent oxidoreductase [Methylobacterium organophilum]|uniref:Coenzyme F420-dependent oxidoreductase n=1 Tax=Methylobacterium organophilum TaxID=410 RepID=A0ABQ4TEN5_METOR|nr:LLM class flavin-dependent oxidoreductase [Methylobacterium organophilum]GJE29663.1 Putative coenzyme F420-dependent oxidoreductase [Methylobacterium organophilum]